MKQLLNPIFLLLLLIIFAAPLYANTSILLSKQEQKFLAKNPIITIGSDAGWAPYVISNNDGISGYDADVLALINETSGANFVLKLGKWDEITKSQKTREIDGLSTAVIHKRFSSHSLFSAPYISLEKIIFTRKDLAYPVNDITDLTGKRFGIYKANGLAREIAEKIKDIELIEFESTQELIEGVTTGKADFMLGNAAMFYLLNKSGNPFLKPALFLQDDPLDLVFVLRNDFPEGISIINKSLQAIGSDKLLGLKQKWFASANTVEEVEKAKFTKQELQYLSAKKQLNLCIDPDWMPLEKIEQGKHIGISSDYFKLFQENINIPFTLIETASWDQTLQFSKERECDIISLAMPTEDRKQYLNFTAPLIKTPVVLATGPDITFIDNLAHIDHKKVGIIKNYAFNSIIRKQYPNIDVIDVDNAEDGLQRVVNGELFGYIDTLATVGYMFQTQFIGELKISGKFDEQWQMRIATRNDEPLLLNIMNKLIEQIPEETHQKIFHHYVAINYKKDFNYKLFREIFFISLFVLGLFIFRYYTVEKYNRRIKRQLLIIDNNVLMTTSDLNGNIQQVSNALCQLTGFKKEELIGKQYSHFRHPKMDASVYKDLWATIKRGDVWEGEILNLKKCGASYWSTTKVTPIYTHKGNKIGYTGIIQDINDKKRLEELAITDVLTQIPNRLFINNTFSHEFERSKRYKSHFSVILIDVDHFKQINDTYGHKAGDDVLINLATIFKQNIRQLDHVARWGGEEFLIICPESSQTKAAILAEKIKDIIEDFEFSPDFAITCSFGIAQSTPNDTEAAIFHRVDKALYQAKNAGRNQVKLS